MKKPAISLPALSRRALLGAGLGGLVWRPANALGGRVVVVGGGRVHTKQQSKIRNFLSYIF